MSERKSYHVVSREAGDWAVKLAGAERASKCFEKKSDAIVYAKERARQVSLGQVLIHKQDKNEIQAEYTYGKDPVKYPG